jgi:hypothetical protein
VLEVAHVKVISTEAVGMVGDGENHEPTIRTDVEIRLAQRIVDGWPQVLGLAIGLSVERRAIDIGHSRPA